MTSDWHRDVGTILASSLLIQAVLALVLWAVPMVVFKLKRAALKGGVLHRYARHGSQLHEPLMDPPLAPNPPPPNRPVPPPPLSP
jgi:hypothetical protein